MLRALGHRALSTASNTLGRRALSTASKPVKVAVLGASGGIGQPLALLCKLSEHISEVACYDVVGTPGVAARPGVAGVASLYSDARVKRGREKQNNYLMIPYYTL